MKTDQTIDVAAVSEGFRGQVLLPPDEGYDRYRRVWNAMIDRHPAVILRCADVNDVVRAVRFARERELLTSVRGGGHNVAGLAVCEDGVMIDLSAMRGVDVDAEAKRAVVQGGATWSDVDTMTHRYGLATTGGHVGTTGVGGLTLGGGFGFLHGMIGLASDNLLSAEVVTAEGDVLVASERENEELFWGLRGGGGNFGVVTSFEFALHEVDTAFVGVFMFPKDRGLELLEAYDAFTRTTPDALTTVFITSVVPEIDLFPEAMYGMEVTSIITVYPNATLDEGERAVQPIAELGPMDKVVQVMSYPELQSANDTVWIPGGSYYWKSGRLNELQGAAKAIVDPAPGTYLTGLVQLGGAITHKPADATAYAHRDARFQFLCASLWMDPADNDAQIAASRETWRAVEPHIDGAFVNFLSTDDENRVPDAYPGHGERLASIKRAYDPDNFFRMNANITPA